jgi:hypothetical protein
MNTVGSIIRAAKKIGVSIVRKIKDFFFTRIKNSLDMMRNSLSVFMFFN